jgi:hypothetical protein
MSTQSTQAELAHKAHAMKPALSKSAYTLDELTELGDGCRSYLYQEIAAGRLRAVKRGRRTIVLAEDRETWRASWPTVAPKNVA